MAQINKNSAFLCIVMLFSFVLNGHAQTAAFIAGGIDDYLRANQLIGKGNSSNSFTIKSFSKSLEVLDSLTDFPQRTFIKKGSGYSVKWLPFSLTSQFNSHHPYGWNDGSLISARGVSAKLSAGISAQFGKIVIQLQPEFVYAQNNSFETFFSEYYDTTWSRNYQWLNRSDIPERFGDRSYKKVFGGQSSIRYNWESTSLGISTENLWWGPGTRNALVMSNNAPGFLHLTFNSIKPLQTRMGSFEWQIIGGKLNNSGILPPERNRVFTNGIGFLYQPKNEGDRYLTGMVLSWQPKWTKGLFLGFAKASYLYTSDISGIADILPLEGIIKSTSEKNGKKASLGSLFIRYVMPEEKAELYMEYGRNDKSSSIINLVADYGYPRAFIAGMKKLFPTKRNSFIEFSAEVTQMQLPTAELIRDAQSWYTHDFVRQGYTNYGQVMGAGIGPGSNSEMLSIAWVKGIKRVGLLFERIVRNNDFYYNAFEQSQDFRRHWTDLSTTLSADWNYKRFLLSARMGLIRSLNYEWWYVDYLPQTSANNYFQNGYDVLNFHAHLSFSYLL